MPNISKTKYWQNYPFLQSTQNQFAERVQLIETQNNKHRSLGKSEGIISGVVATGVTGEI
jgi:hypothetical protein